MMTYEEFLKKVEEALGYEPRKADPSRGRYRWINDGEPAIGIEWSTGGTYGASCWDDSPASHHTEGEIEPDFDELDKILEKVCPKITFMQYRNISREVIKSDTYVDSDYYGNTDSSARKLVLLKNLYNALNERELL